MSLIQKLPLNFQQIGQVLTVVAFISLRFLLDDNMGMSNEVDVLPLAKQFADPGWVSGDWYLNQSPGYRLLFASLFGKFIVTWGFLATSILGRLLCYALVGLGLVLIGQCLGLTLPLLVVALGLFFASNPNQGVAAQEWLVGSLEAKAIAYGLVLLAIYYLLKQQHLKMVVMLGLATSFHVLVGGWTTLIVLALVLLKHRIEVGNLGQLCRLVLTYLLFSCVAIPPVAAHLFSKPISYEVAPSFIYVFLRLPHHLNPASWDPGWWLPGVNCLVCLLLSMQILHWKRKVLPFQHYQAQIDLFQLTIISLIPFILGLMITPFDTEGCLLQFYPFRVGDVLLPLNACLLLACAVQSLTDRKQVVNLSCISLIAVICSLQVPVFQEQIAELNQFLNPDPTYTALCNWVKTQTPTDAVVISPPVEFVDFSLLAERPTIAKFKLLPQNKLKIVEWYERLTDLSGGTFPQPSAPHTKDVRGEIRRQLTRGYHQLTSEQANGLIQKYAAGYLMTHADHQLNLPIAYRNDRYILYAAKPLG